MSQILGWLMLKLIVQWIYKKVKPAPAKEGEPKKKPSFVVSMIVKLNNILNLAFYSELAMAVHMDLLMAVFANMRSFWVNPFVMFLNSMLSLGILVFYARMIYIVMGKSMEFENYKKVHGSYPEGDEVEQSLKKWGFLKEEVNKDLSGSAAMINQLQFLRDFLLVFFVLIFIEYPLL